MCMMVMTFKFDLTFPRSTCRDAWDLAILRILVITRQKGITALQQRLMRKSGQFRYFLNTNICGCLPNAPHETFSKTTGWDESERER